MMGFPYETCQLDPNVAEQYLKYFKGTPRELVLLGPKKYFFYKQFEDEASKIYHMKVRPDDTWLVTIPRSGTTLTQEIIWQVAHDMDSKKADEQNIFVKFPGLTRTSQIDPKLLEEVIQKNPQMEKQIRAYYKNHVVDILDANTNKRFIKSHLPLSLAPIGLLDNAKVIYVARDPRDVAVSSYHMNKLFKFFQYEGDFKTFWQFFINGTIMFTPYFEHVKEAWKERSNPNLLFLFYEDMNEDKSSTIRRIASFLNKHPTDEAVSELSDRLHIDNFRNNSKVNGDSFKQFGWMNDDCESFIRKGEVGGWRDYFDDEMTQQAEEWIKANLKDTNLRFPSFELN